MIYLTTFDTTTMQATAASTDSGFSDLGQVVACMGPPKHQQARWMTYPDGVAFSDFPFRLTAPSDSGYHAGN